MTTGCGGSNAGEAPTGEIAFVHTTNYRKGQLWLMTADGSEQRALTRDYELGFTGPPAWSPDGRLIAYPSDGGDYVSQISVVNPDGSGRRTLSRLSSYGENRDPAWSPDGRTIAYEGYADGDYGLNLVGADGSGDRYVSPERWDYESPGALRIPPGLPTDGRSRSQTCTPGRCTS